MVTEELETEIVTDLLRSAWLVEAARSRTLEHWATHEERFHASSARASRRAELVAASLGKRGEGPDAELVHAHARWMEGVIGDRPGVVPFGDLFLVRLGDWVQGHAGPFLSEAEEFQALTDEEHAAVVWPDQLPDPPPFEPLAPVETEAPGGVRFTFGILGDTHLGSDLSEPLVRSALEDLHSAGVELIVQLGDVTNHGTRGEFELAAEVFRSVEVPLITMMGNHDVYSYEEEALTGRDLYEAHFGRAPDGTLVEHSGIRFAVLDSVEHGISPFAPFNLVTGSFAEGKGGAVVRGSLTAQQHDILAEVARPGSAPAFVFLHHPPQPFTSFPPIVFGLCDADTGRLHATADSGNVWGVFAGHTHRNARSDPFGGVPVVEVGIPRDYPFGYALVDVTDGGYRYRWRQISNHELLRESVQLPGEIQRRYATGPNDARGFSWVR